MFYGQEHEPNIWKTLFGRICTIVNVIGYAIHDSLISTNQFVKIIEQGKRFQVQSLEVISYINRRIPKEQLIKISV
ncbi:MAG: hypothetical protein CL661_09060 [Bacteroidetes bacterium]|nr:hypothetical protein [Bacteroidota bacterium]